MIARDDLESARAYLRDDPSAKVVAVKDGVVLGIEYGDGLRPLLRLIQSAESKIQGACVADRVIGEAAAVLLIDAGVSAVHGEIMSADARSRLMRHLVRVSFDQCVPYILRRGISVAQDPARDRCVMEQLVAGVDDIEEAVNRIRLKLA